MLPDLGILTIPLLAVASAFGLAVLLGEEIAIDKIDVAGELENYGYTSQVVTRQLTDELRTINSTASSELVYLELDASALEEGVDAFEEYFNLTLLVNGTRNLLGLIPYYVTGELISKQGEAILISRVYIEESINREADVKVIRLSGDPANLEPILHEAALEIIQEINPYIVALYYRREERAAGEYDFPRTKRALQRYYQVMPPDKHYAGYGLEGRMYMLKAQEDPSLNEEEQEQTMNKARRYLHAALIQKPDFLFPLLNLAIIHADDGDYAESDRYFAKAVRSQPNHALTRKRWAEALLLQGRTREAILQYVAAVELEPRNPELRATLAELYSRIGRAEAARTQWQRAIELEPANEDYVNALQQTAGVAQ